MCGTNYQQSVSSVNMFKNMIDKYLVIILIIIMAGMAVLYVAGYLIEERCRWPVITASPREQCSK